MLTLYVTKLIQIFPVYIFLIINVWRSNQAMKMLAKVLIHYVSLLSCVCSFAVFTSRWQHSTNFGFSSWFSIIDGIRSHAHPRAATLFFPL